MKLQIYQGCGQGGYKLDKTGNVVFKKGEPVTDPSKLTAESRLVFQFAPKPNSLDKNGQVRFVQGKEVIQFVITNGYSGYKFPMTNPTVGTSSENLNYLEPVSKVIPPKDNWIALTEYLGETFEAEMLPGDYYRNPDLGKKGKLLKNNSEGIPEMTTADMQPGFYIVTLQNDATFAEQVVPTCPKTTPPVLIEIVSEVLAVELKPRLQGPVSFQNVGNYTVMANIKGSGPFDLEWLSDNPSGVDVSGCPKYSDTNQVVCDAVKTVTGNLTEGERAKISVTVTTKSGKADCKKNNKCSELIINNVPTIKLTIVDNKNDVVNGYPVIITAKASDKDVPSQKLAIKNWKIFDLRDVDNINDDIEISVPADSTFVDNGDNSQTLIINSGLKISKYKFEATVTDTLDESTNNNIGDIVLPGGAGINYFGFANPFPNKEGELDPEIWTKDRKRANLSPYPSVEFRDFYYQTGATEPGVVRTNTEKLIEIVQKLKDRPNFKLYIYGYADFKYIPPYNNIELARRRITVVVGKLKQLARELGINENRFISGGIVEIRNCGDSQARSRDENNWTDGRRHDRRVELIYVFGDEEPKIPTYVQDCVPSTSSTSEKYNRQNAKQLSGLNAKKRAR